MLKKNPIYVSNTREFPGEEALFEIKDAENSSGYTIKNLGLDKYVSPREERVGEPIFPNGFPRPFSIEEAGGDVYVIKATTQDLVWTVREPFLPHNIVALWPQQGKITQLFRIVPYNPDLVYQPAPASAKFRAEQPSVENIFRQVKVILQYFPYGGN